MKPIFAVGLALFLSLGASPLLQAQEVAPAATSVIKAQDTKGTPDERADQLIAQMTLAEKISLIGGDSGGFNTHAIARLGIPPLTMSDGPNGVRNPPNIPPINPAPPQLACAFPCGAALAATWDPDMAAAYGKAIGLEDRARGVNFQLGPGLNICRVPVNGRNFEYFGEDPYLASILAVNWVKACSAQGSVPTIKHFAANNQEDNRNSVDAQVDPRVLEEIYLPAFKKAATEGGIVAVMCSYNRLNGFYASANDWLLNQTLKKEWGFQGLVMSDWGASHATTDVMRGLDLEMPNSQNFNNQRMQAALASGEVSEININLAVHRILRTAAAQGWLDAGWQQRNEALPLDSPESSKTALAVAENAIVLLKNDRQTLPLDRAKVKKIVVLGPNASAAPGQMPANIGGGGSGAVATFPAHYAEADYLTGITRAAGSNISVVYLPLPNSANVSYASLPLARTSALGEPGLTLHVELDVQGPSDPIPALVQTNIDVSWQPGQLPFGVPANTNATFTWTGVLISPTNADWQLLSQGNVTVTIDGRTNAAGAIFHLAAGKPAPIRIQSDAQATPPAGRGGRGGRGGGFGGGGRGGRGGPAATATAIRVTIAPAPVPDLSPARDADAVVVCIGLNRNVEAEGRDRPFELPELQQYLVNAAAAVNPHTIVINNSGAGVGMTGWATNAGAILQAWYLGQEGGIAVGETLFGDVNPSGHLISTFDKKFEDNPAYPYYPGTNQPGSSYPVEPYTEGLFYGYRGYDKAAKEPMYPFGFGLSYTTFELSNLRAEKSGPNVKVSVDLRNTGARAGAQVAQIYVGEVGCAVPRPARELKGFSKVSLEPGKTKRVEITLAQEAFAYWNPVGKGWVVDVGGQFTIEAGFSERDLRARQTISY